MKRIDDLQCNGLMLVQDDSGYCFTTDAILLANFVKTKKTDFVLEFCAGTGVISTLIMGKQSPKKIVAVELQEECCKLFNESNQMNGFDKKIEVCNTSIQDFKKVRKNELFDVVVVNPPYYKSDQSQNSNKAIALSTHEIALSIDDVFCESSRMLKFGGKFYMVHHTDRLVELIVKMSKHQLEPKVIQFVQPKVNSDANLVVVQAVKGGKTGVKIKNGLVFRDEDGNESEAVKKIYGRLE